MELAILFLALSIQDKPAQPGAAMMPFSQVFDLQVDATNDAVRAYGNALCTQSNFPQLTLAAKRQYGLLVDLHNHLPQTEDEDTRIKQTELFIGVRFVTAQVSSNQNHCLYENFGAGHEERKLFPPADEQ